MGNRANFVIVKDQAWQLYYSHWGGCRMLDALVGGPELALRYAASLRRCEKNEWCDPSWADGGSVVDLDRRRVLFFGEPLMVTMNERRALMDVLAIVWPDYEISWAYDGTEEIAGYVGASLPPDDWDRQPTLKLARGRNHLCHLISVVDADGQLRFWPLWWHLSKAWHGPALLDKLPGPGIRRIRLGKIPEGGAHIDVRRKTLGAWQTADTMGFFHALPELWPGWQTEVWEDRFEEHVKRCDGALRVPELDVSRGHRQRRGVDPQAGIREIRRQPGWAHRQARGDAGARRAGIRGQPGCPRRLRRAPDQGRVVSLRQRVRPGAIRQC